MLLGEYNHSIDEKGRVRIPKNFRDDLGEIFYITKGFDKCLFVYSEKDWLLFQEKLNRNQLNKKDHRRIQRFFNGSAMETSLDGQGRATLSQALRTYAMLEKDVVVTGMSSRIEIWSKDAWDDYQAEMEDISDLADDLEDIDL
jgi:MraZ protein